MDKSKYKRAFDSVHAPEDMERRVLNAVSGRPGRFNRRMALILCAILLLSCTAALAAGTAGQWLETIISLNGRALPDSSLQKINQTCEDGGLRMTLNSVAGDGVHTYFLMDVEALSGQNLSNTAPDSIPMTDSLYTDFLVELPSSGGYGARTLRIDDGSDPSRAQLVLKVDFGEPRNGDQMTLTISEVNRWIRSTDENGKQVFSLEPVAEGEWIFSFRLNRNLDGVHYRISDYDFDITISPLGLAVNGVGSNRMFGTDAYLLMEDGSKVELVGFGSSRNARNSIVYHELVSYEFTALIDADRAAALVYSGNEYPLVKN